MSVGKDYLFSDKNLCVRRPFQSDRQRSKTERKDTYDLDTKPTNEETSNIHSWFSLRNLFNISSSLLIMQ